MKSDKLSIATKAGFGIGDLGGNLFFTAMGILALNYLTDTVALTAAAAGFALMISKFWDAVTDPVMGYISDRTTSRWGRRRPYILFGSIPLGLSMWYFFTNPGISGGTALTVWAVLALCLLNTGFTIVNVPYSALTPELTKDYNERTSLNSFRFGFAIIGTVIGGVLIQPFALSFVDRNAGFSAAGAVMGAVVIVTSLITFFAVREKPHNSDEMPDANIFKTYISVFKNKAYLILLFSYALNMLAITFLQSIVIYYFKYVYLDESKTPIAMGIFLLVAMLFIPVSVPLSKKIGKHRTYQLGFLFLGMACLLIYFFGHILGQTYFFAVMALAGVGLGLAFVAPWAMVPDTIEWDARKTGDRKEGTYYGMWTFISKSGQALSIGISGLLLGKAGYVADIPQTERSLEAIRVLIGPIPALIFFAGIVLMAFYPITEKTYNEMMSGAK